MGTTNSSSVHSVPNFEIDVKKNPTYSDSASGFSRLPVGWPQASLAKTKPWVTEACDFLPGGTHSGGLFARIEPKMQHLFLGVPMSLGVIRLDSGALGYDDRCGLYAVDPRMAWTAFHPFKEQRHLPGRATRLEEHRAIRLVLGRDLHAEIPGLGSG
jgi:hypothetical protein